mgnify:CR=1 FL=1
MEINKIINKSQQLQQSEKIIGFVPVVFALVGNIFVVALKFAGFLISGSSALFSETIHSVADTLNQGLLMVGIKRSQKKADEDFSYGFGHERFVWALISACGIFFIGSGVTIYHGIQALIERKEVHISQIIFIILIASFIIETFTFWKAWKELSKDNTNLKKILEEGDSASLAVLFEDGIAVLGVAIAFISITLTLLTGSYFWDALGSIIVGILLGIVAIILINKNRGLLVGKSIPDEIKERVIEILETDPAVEKVLDFKSSTLDANIYRVKCEVEFNGSALIKEIYKDKFIKNQYKIIKDDYGEFVKFCVDYVDRVPRLMGKKIDVIEEKIKKEIPKIKHIDIEIN